MHLMIRYECVYYMNVYRFCMIFFYVQTITLYPRS